MTRHNLGGASSATRGRGGPMGLLVHHKRWFQLALAVVALVVVADLLSGGGFTGELVTQMLVMAIAALGVGFLGGYGGMVSLGQAGFLGLGAYGIAVAMREGAGPWTAVLYSLVVTLVVALVTGLIAVRVRQLGFVIMTLALGQILFGLSSSWVAVSGGDNGLSVPENPTLGPLDLNDQQTLSFTVLVVFVLALLTVRLIVNAPFGLALRGIKSNEQRLKTLGYGTRVHLYISWVISVIFAGVAGILYAFTNGLITPVAMDFGHNGIITLMAVVGGLGTLWGPAVGAVVIMMFQQYLSIYFERWATAMGVLFVVVVIFAPEGLWGLVTRLGRKVTQQQSSSAPPGPEGLAGDDGQASESALPDPAMTASAEKVQR